MKKLHPNIYTKSIYSVNYDKLYKQGKRVILFDLDNTLIAYYQNSTTKNLKKLIINIKKKGFDIYIFSNSIKEKKVKKIAKELDIKYNLFSLKPLKYNFKKIIKKNNYKPEEIIIIGDQLFTDILGGNKISITTILVDPQSKNEPFFTRFIRIVERYIKKKGNIKIKENYE